ncbi:MAG TPA: endopeptidase La [Bacteroidales bacterium]|nr:endopeptidase La [Bacteroidales bacterium]HRZ49927.1 endopeptidase La [Bacteroidales bacterium]
MNHDNARIILGDVLNDDAEMIPLLSSEDEERMNREKLPPTLPILPLRNMILFPGVVVPITVGRDKSIRLIRDFSRKSKIIGVVAQKDPDIEEPMPQDLHRVGTAAVIIKTLQMPDGSTTVIIQGKKRFEIEEVVQTEPYMFARIRKFERASRPDKSEEFKALIDSLRDISLEIIEKSPQIPSEASFAIKNIDSPAFLVNFVSSNLSIPVEEKQMLLETPDLRERAAIVLKKLTEELQLLELKNQIQSKVKTDIDKQQRDYFLSQQLKTIQEELGGSPGEQDIRSLREKAAKKHWNEAVAEVFEREIQKLQRMNVQAADYAVQLNYLEFLTELPWNEYTEDRFDLAGAIKVLNEDHFGLDKVKERIIEYLAVIRLKGDMKSPILCLVGPPGVGKTSLGKSVARALGRKYVRMSLGGLRDEAEIRGHRKTYIGALPGRILQSIKKSKSSNPVFVLDEIDKVSGNNVNGDPSSALLEVLDPEQNTAFYDNYLEMEYDLSKVMFIATANNLTTIHPALRDRMEVIDLSGYLMEEKVDIARIHLIPKQLSEHGVKPAACRFSDEVIRLMIEDYTREAGVRLLEKCIARIVRSRARDIVAGTPFKKKIPLKDAVRILGVPLYQKESRLRDRLSGVATGLAWTPTGGEILFIEATASKGKGVLTLTGNLGDVMKESATLAFEYLKSNAGDLGIDPQIVADSNVHVHVPEGATPKDGPSAGVAMLTAITSVFLHKPIRNDLAMTGEITLRGKVLPVGGIKEKILAAKRAKIPFVILPEANRKDVEEIQPLYVEGITFHYVDKMKEVLDLSLS